MPVIKLLLSSKFSLFACSLKMKLSCLNIFHLLTKEGNGCSALSLENSGKTLQEESVCFQVPMHLLTHFLQWR